MWRNLERSRAHYESVINDRNLQSLTIALTTMVIVWMLAFGAVFVSNQIGTQSSHLADLAPVATIAK